MKRNLILSIVIFLAGLVAADRALFILAQRGHDAPAYPPYFSDKTSWMGRNYGVKANDLGIRYPKIPLRRTPSDEKRIVVIGHSFVEGIGVRPEDRFTERLEAATAQAGRRVLFINCGVSGAGPQEYLRLLKEVGFLYRPDAVLVMIYATDLDDTRFPSVSMPERDTVKTEYRMFREIIARLRSFIRLFRRAQDGENDFSEILKLAKEKEIFIEPGELEKMKRLNLGDARLLRPFSEPEYFQGQFNLEGPKIQKKWARMKMILEAMVQACRLKGVPIHLAYMPHPYQYDPGYDPLPQKLGLKVDKRWLTQETEFEKSLRFWCQNQKLPWADMTSFLRFVTRRDGRSLHFEMDPHWNEAGHAAVSKFFLASHAIPKMEAGSAKSNTVKSITPL